MKPFSKKTPTSSEIIIWLIVGFLFSMIGLLGEGLILFFVLLPQVGVLLTQLVYLLIENQKFLSIKLVYSFAVINIAYFTSYGFFKIFN